MASLRILLSAVLTALLVGRVRSLVEQEFAPQVTATCKAGYMTIRVQTNSSFIGAVHAKEFRTPACMVHGNGSSAVTLTVNLFAPSTSSEYCGVAIKNRTEDRSLPIAVRIHKTLELADDKFYVITCGKSGFRNSRNETSVVSLKMMDPEGKRRLQEVFYGRRYLLRAQVSKPDGSHGIKVRSCFAFNKRDNNNPLIDERGCPSNKLTMSSFNYNSTTGVADAIIYSMFQFPDGNHIHFQCDVVICRGGCSEISCDGLSPTGGTSNEDGVAVASTNAFVLQPGDTPSVEEVVEVAGVGWGPAWLLYLAIALGLLFLLMLIVNVFLCSAMTCSCARTEVVEKEPSIIDDYDPYRTWHGSTHYGSRYSLNGKPGYVSGGSTLNSARSISTNSDHYAIVDSRLRPPPGAHYSRKH